MSRTQIVLDSKNNQQSSKVIEEILDSHGFDKTSKKGEDYWQQGIGVTQSPKYIRYYFDGDKVILEGWVSNFGRESDLSGVVGSIPKRTCKKILKEIEKEVKNINEHPPSAVVENKPETVKDNQVSSAVEPKVTPETVEDNQVSSVAEPKVNLETLTDDLFNYLDGNPTSGNKTVSGGSGNISDIVAQNSTDVVSSNKKVSKGILPRKYRASIGYSIFEVILAVIYLIGASSGYLVLRFTNSSEALMVVALIMLVHGSLSLISYAQEN